MAVLAKKLRIKASGGAQQAANIYSTLGEANNNAMRVSVDGVAGYVALGSTGDTRRTNGRVKKSNGTTYAVLTNGTPDYGYRVLTANGSFTVPTGVTKLRVTCVGGGAGGGNFVQIISTGAGGSNNQRYINHTAGAGGTTSFGSVVANGGTASYERANVGVTFGTGDNADRFYGWNNARASSYGFHNGGEYVNTGSSYGGGAAVPLTLYNGTQVATAGAGGYADGNGKYSGDYYAGCRTCPGASGYRTISTINVTPGQVIGYSIGGGGYWGQWGNLSMQNDFITGWGSTNAGGMGQSQGSAGAILVEWGKGIQ